MTFKQEFSQEFCPRLERVPELSKVDCIASTQGASLLGGVKILKFWCLRKCYFQRFPGSSCTYENSEN